jgi:hypothetical protein
MARQGAIARSYLLLYNTMQFSGWSYCLYLLAKQAAAVRSLDGAFSASGGAVRELLQPSFCF